MKENRKPSGNTPLDDKIRLAAAKCMIASANTKPEPLDCAKEAELQAVILYPALGTPHVAPTSDQKIRLFLIVEGKCEKQFGIAGDQAPHAWYFINKHLRIYKFSEAKKTSANLKSDPKLYQSEGQALEGITVWYHGTHGSEPKDGKGLGWANRLIDHEGKILANLRERSIAFFVTNPPTAAFPDIKNVVKTTNNPLPHLFEIELKLPGLTGNPQPEEMYTLAWMVTCVYSQKEAGFKDAVSHWEHQDKLTYDFFHYMKEDSRGRRHYANPYVFDIDSAKQGAWPKQKDKSEKDRIKPFHPFIFKNGKNSLDIGHLSDIHVSSRQFALAKSNASVLEGKSQAVGQKLANCLVNCTKLFDKLPEERVDAIFLTGDLIDHNINLDPNVLGEKDASPAQQWKHYNLAANVDDSKTYPRGLDDMLVYSVVKRSYERNMPVFMISGNHEAYDEPFGISPRMNAYAYKRAGKPDDRAKKKVPTGPRIAAYLRQGPLSEESLNPNSYSTTRGNEGIPADHNLTIYEACLIYGPTHTQIMQSWDFMPDNFDWFYTLFTPLADFSVPYKEQLFTAVEWGDAERMVELTFNPSPGGRLPRASESLSDRQKALVENACRRKAKQHFLFTHFTAVCYYRKKAYAETDRRRPHEVGENETYGAFEKNRLRLFQWLANGDVHGHYCGHSHRSGGYQVTLGKTPEQNYRRGNQSITIEGSPEITVAGHDPAKQKPSADAKHWVASNCGGIGIQNLIGELEGWNLMPPSGNCIDGKTGKVTKVVAVPEVQGAKPRFCVALDYLQRIDGKDVVVWYANGKDLEMLVTDIHAVVPFIQSVAFHVWDADMKEFATYPLSDLKHTPSSKASNLRYTCTTQEPLGLFKKLKKAAAFAEIKFTKALAAVSDSKAGAKLYDQFNFDDPWIFRVCFDESTRRITCDPDGEVPNWVWLAKTFESAYPQLDAVTRMPRGPGR